jgi:eukaryotic-like serine/threonine-protein kinase
MLQGVTPIALTATQHAAPSGDFPPSSHELRARERVACTLDGYVLEKVLGVGGQAVVYAAREISSGRERALKILHAELTTYPSVVERLFREADLVNRIDDPGVVHVIARGRAPAGEPFGGAPYLMMERLHGRSLAARIDRELLPAEQLFCVGEGILRPLARAHEMGIVHRDLKPDNVFLGRGGEGPGVRVRDFGIGSAPHLELPKLTADGAAIGTPAFWSPEAAGGQAVDARADVYGVGATLFQAAGGELVHGNRLGGLQYIARLLLAPSRSVREVAPHLPRALSEVIDRALSPLGDRYADAGEMLAALRRAARIVA